MAKTIHARAVISATDNASGVFRSIGAAGEAAFRRLSQAGGVVTNLRGNLSAMQHKLHSTQALSMAMPSALSVGSLGHNQYEWDRATTQFKAISEVAPDTYRAIESEVLRVSNAFGINKLELLDAAKGWVEIGGKAEAVVPVLEGVAKSAKIAGVGIKETLVETRGLLMAFGMDTNNAENILDMENFFLVASKMVKGGGHALTEAMKNAAPVAGGMAHMTKERTAAWLSTMIDGNFAPGEAGNAIKTGLMRLYAPSKDTMLEMRAAGIDREKLFTTDAAKVKNWQSLAERMRAQGMNVSAGVEKVLKAELGGYDGKRSFNQVSDRLMKGLGSTLGLKKGDAQNRRLVQKMIDQHMANSFDQINEDELFKLRNAPKQAFIKIFGKEHGAKWWELVQNAVKARQREAEIEHQKVDAITRKSAIYFQGFAAEWDKVKTSWDNMLASTGGGQINKDLASLFRGVSSFFRDLHRTDPETVRALFYAGSAFASLPVAAVFLGSLAVVIGALTSPAILAVGAISALGVAFYAAYKNWEDLKAAFMGDKEARDRLMGRGRYDKDAERHSVFDFNMPKNHDSMGWWERLTTRNPRLVADPTGQGGVYTDEASSRYSLPRHVAGANSEPIRLLRDAAPDQWGGRYAQQGPVEVTGTVSGRMESEIRIIAPEGFSAYVSRKSGGDVSGPLNTGKSMPDTGAGQ